ncbi:MAG: glycine betaine ABC transporter substrate-binding protein [Actinomycetota bacterium]
MRDESSALRTSVATILLATFVLGSCRAEVPRRTSALDDRAITVGSFNFPESVILGEIYAQALEGGGFAVERQFGIGARELVEPSLERGLVEFVPEYSGSALEFLTGGAGQASPDEGVTHERLTAAFAERGVAVLAPAPAQNRNGFAVTRATAERYGLETISDLGPVAADLAFGGSHECPQRPLCLAGLEETYGLDFGRFTPLDAAGPITVSALRAGTVDVALLFTTDGAIAENDFVLLVDDRGLQPAENVTPVVRAEVIESYGAGFVVLVDSVSEQLTTADLRELNARVSVSGELPSEVAAAWLAEHGFAGPSD